MAYDGGYGGQGRPYAGGAGPRPVPQRQYPPGPGGPPQQYNNGPPQQYDQYQDEYGYEYDEYSNGYDPRHGGQYDDMNHQRGPPAGNYPPQPPQQDYYGPGPNGPGRGGRPMQGGRGGPMQRPPNGDGGRGGYYPRGGGPPPGPGRGGYPPQGRGGRPAPLERNGNSDPTSNRGMMNGPASPGDSGFGGSPFPTFPGHHRKTDLQEETQIVTQMAGMDMNQGPGPGPRGPPGRGPMGPPRGGQPYPPQDYSGQRRAPPGPGYGGYQDDGFGPPERSMTMPAREPMDMRGAAPPPPNRTETLPINAGRGMPGRPSTAQAMRPPPQRGYPPNSGPGGQREQRYDNPPDPRYSGPQGPQGQQRPASFDDFYDYYDTPGPGNTGNPQPPQDANPPPPDMPNFDALSPPPGRSSFELHMGAAPGPREQGGPGRQPELSRTKSQPDLRNSQTAVFEMAGDIPPVPAQYQQQAPPPLGNFQGGLPSGPNPRRQSPPGALDGGLPSGPAPYRPGAQGAPQGGPSADTLPLHPTPVRPGLMPNSIVNLSNKPPPVRNYGNTAPAPQAVPQQAPPPQVAQVNVGPPAAKQPEEIPVTVQELEHLRSVIKADPGDQASALRLAKRLAEAADVLVPNLPDPKSRGRARERYLVDAQKILKKLASSGNPDAMFFLADCLGRGLFGAEPDSKEAFTLYQSAAKIGHPAAAYRTAVCCEIGNEEGGGTRKDPMKAIQWYKRAATLGDTPAMYKVGMILLKGLLGQPRNPREAVGWLKRAAERADSENPHALHELGLLYESAQPNDAILRDEPYAFSLFKKAAELGYKFSQFRLGCAFEYGLMGCPIDPRLSIMWYSRAATQEEHQSELALSGWYLTGSEGVLGQSDTEAYLWARKAAIAGLAKAEYAMGYFTEVGIGVPANLEDAKRWYWRAAAQDFPKARERLEDLKRSGKNGPRARERISRSKIGKQQEGECTVM